jgi:TusA-related sulfurtransferase
MTPYTIEDAQHGKTVLIRTDDDQVVQLIPVFIRPQEFGSYTTHDQPHPLSA